MTRREDRRGPRTRPLWRYEGLLPPAPRVSRSVSALDARSSAPRSPTRNALRCPTSLLKLEDERTRTGLVHRQPRHRDRLRGVGGARTTGVATNLVLLRSSGQPPETRVAAVAGGITAPARQIVASVPADSPAALPACAAQPRGSARLTPPAPTGTYDDCLGGLELRRWGNAVPRGDLVQSGNPPPYAGRGPRRRSISFEHSSRSSSVSTAAPPRTPSSCPAASGTLLLERSAQGFAEVRWHRAVSAAQSGTTDCSPVKALGSKPGSR
jgi:hypothetical protein